MTKTKIVNKYHCKLFEETLKIKNTATKTKKSNIKCYGDYLAECMKDIIEMTNSLINRAETLDLTTEAINFESGLSSIILFKLSQGLNENCLDDSYKDAKLFLSEINKVILNVDNDEKTDFCFTESIYNKGKSVYIENEKLFKDNKFLNIIKTGLTL